MIFAALLALPALAEPAPTMRVHSIDVGQGAATLVEFPCGAMLVDTGGEGGPDATFDSDAALGAYLDAFFARRTDLHGLDLLVLTHPHLDHVRSVERVFTDYKPRNIVDNGQMPKQKDALKAMQAVRAYVAAGSAKYKEVRADKFLPSGKPLTSPVLDPFKECKGVNPSVTALWGQVPIDPGWGLDPGKKKLEFDDENNHSVVTRVTFGESSLVIMGDLEAPAIHDMLAARTPAGLDADILQVGHHGSDNATTLGLLRAVSPEWALLGVGPADRQGDWTAHEHGHPREATIKLLQQEVSGRRHPIDTEVATGKFTFVPRSVDAAIYATGWEGSVVVEADADGRTRLGTPDWLPPAVDLTPMVVANAAPSLKVTFIDVDEGDAILLQLGTLDVLVDAGKLSNVDRYLKGALASLSGPLDSLVITHPHIDHYGGAAAVLGAVEVEEVVTNGESRGKPRDPQPSRAWDDFTDAVKAEKLTIKRAVVGTDVVNEGGLRVSVLATGGTYKDTPVGHDINDDSVVLLAEYAGKRILLTGDIEARAERDLVKRLCPPGPASCHVLDVDVLKVPHHGSADLDENFFAATKPAFAVFSAGFELENNHWLPTVNALDVVRALGAKVYSTSAAGSAPVVLEVSATGELAWTAPSQPGFFWTQADGEWVGVDVPQGQ